MVTNQPNRKSVMAIRLKPAFAVLLLACALSLACKTQPPASSNPNSSGWTLNDDRHVSLSEYKGKVVLLDFYATWCEPCRLETPHLVKMDQQYGPQGLQIIGLNVGGDEDRDKIPEYARDLGIQYQLGFPDDELFDAYLSNNRNIPQALVFDRDGRMVKRFVGYNESIREELEHAVQTSLASGQ